MEHFVTHVSNQQAHEQIENGGTDEGASSYRNPSLTNWLVVLSVTHTENSIFFFLIRWRIHSFFFFFFKG